MGRPLGKFKGPALNLVEGFDGEIHYLDDFALGAPGFFGVAVFLANGFSFIGMDFTSIGGNFSTALTGLAASAGFSHLKITVDNPGTTSGAEYSRSSQCLTSAVMAPRLPAPEPP